MHKKSPGCGASGGEKWLCGGLISAHGSDVAFNNAEIVVRAVGDGAHLCDASVFLRLLYRGITRFPYPEPGGGGSNPDAGGKRAAG